MSEIPVWTYTKRALEYTLPYKRLMIASVVVILSSATFSLLEPWPLQFLIDNVLGGRHGDHVLTPGGPLAPFAHNRVALLIFATLAGFAVVLGRHVMLVVDNYIHTKLSYLIVLDFRSELFQHVQRVSLQYHDSKRAGNFMSRIGHSSFSIGFIPRVVPGMLQSLITLVGMFWVSFLLDKTVALLALAVIPCLVYLTQVYSRRIMPQVLAANRLEGQSMAVLFESVSMIRVVLSFAREQFEYRRFRAQGEAAADTRVRVTVKQTLYSLAVTCVTAGGIALVTGIGGYHVLTGQLTVGELIVILAYIRAMYLPLEQLSSTASIMQEHYVGIHRCYELMSQEPEIQDAPHATRLRHVEGRITFENVSFDYAERHQTLKNVSFDVPPGKVVAIVGPTGAGKSTLASLVLRFHDPAGGRVLLDGKDIREVKARSLRRQISVVLQEPLLFSTTIANNIRYGKLDASTEEIIEAAKAASVHDSIMALPHQYNTRLGERGARFSGGERQRISIARAFLKNAPILILDEPTSSVDSRTEAVILDSLDRLMEGRTTLVIAHRLSTVRHADMIFVLKDGELVEQGTHQELVERNGLYQELHALQMSIHRGPSVVQLPSARLRTSE